MKVALACDFLLGQNYQTKVVESLVMLFPDSEIFTLAHQVGSAIGPIEQRKIHSSFLSHFVKTEEDFWKWTPMAPGAASNLHIPCSFDLVVCVGSGFASMISHCKTTPKLTYLLSNYRWWPDQKGFRDKLFRGFVKSAVDKAVNNSRIVVAASENFLNDHADAPKDIIAPPVKIDRFPLFPKAQRNLLNSNYWLVDESSFEFQELDDLVEFMKSNKFSFRLLKAHERDSQAKGEFLNDDLLAPVAANSKGMIIGSKKVFSDLAIKEMACGRPVLMSARSGLQHFISSGEGAAVYSNFNELKDAMIEFQGEEYRPEKVRGVAMKFNDIKFKIGWNKFAENHANRSI